MVGRTGSKLSSLVSNVFVLPFIPGLTVVLALDSQSKSTIVNIASVEETRATHDWFEEDVEDARYG